MIIRLEDEFAAGHYVGNVLSQKCQKSRGDVENFDIVDFPPVLTDGPARAKKPQDEWSLLLKNSGNHTVRS